MKPKLILKSLADIPADALSLAASMPGRAVNVSKQVLGPAVRATRRELRAARRGSAAVARDLYARAGAPFQFVTPWQRGGLNE
ncbi:MAG: hypothetical protein U1F98_12890 [Verrucomicrobiota bacterium]